MSVTIYVSVVFEEQKVADIVFIFLHLEYIWLQSDHKLVVSTAGERGDVTFAPIFCGQDQVVHT